MTLTPTNDPIDDTAVTEPAPALMCRPDYFTVSYRINPWMFPENPTNTTLAVEQWERLYAIYQELGFDVHLIDPIEGLPDMVYSANGGFTLSPNSGN